MNKQEAIEEIMKVSERFYACDYIKTTVAESIISQIHEPQAKRIREAQSNFQKRR